MGDGESKSTFMLGCWKEYATAVIEPIREIEDRDTEIMSERLLIWLIYEKC